MRTVILATWSASFFALSTASASGALLRVGPNYEYNTPCNAIAAAQDGDRIEIDAAGTYVGDVCGWRTNDLTLVGVNGRPRIDAGHMNAQGKAIWVISGNNTTVENLEFTGETVPDHNGAGIRQEGTNLVVRRCYFHDNQEGILTGSDPFSKILIENTEFAENGYSDGQSHNIYIGRIAEFTLRYSYSHNSISGHLVKSRALRNLILYNRLTGETGSSSYELDLPNGGLSYVIGNIIEQGPLSENGTIVAYGKEGPSNPESNLYFVNNTVVNHRWAGTFIAVDSTIPPPLVENNTFSGAGEIMVPPIGKLSHNLLRSAQFVSVEDYDFHPVANSPARDFGTDPGTVNGYSLRPIYQYVHPTCFETRKTTGAAIDAGAFEFRGGGGASPSCRVEPRGKP